MGAADGELAHVAALELALLDPRVRRGPDLVEALLDPQFREVGASGRVHDLAATVELLEAEQGAPDGADARAGGGPVAEVEGLSARSLGPDAALVTYVSHRDGRRAHRTSVWHRDASGAWTLLHHQGTPATR